MGPTREERLRSAWAALDGYGFRTERSAHDALAPYLPFKYIASPDRCAVRSVGAVDGARVELYDYDCSSQDSDGNWSYDTVLLACVHHPWVAGGAAITLDWKQWSTTAAVIDTLMWFPPFIFLKAFLMAGELRDPDHALGHPEFDRLYYVHAESQEVAARTITPMLGEFLSRCAFRGAIELRPGLIVYTVQGASFDVEGVNRALSYVRGMMQAFPPPQGHPMR